MSIARSLIPELDEIVRHGDPRRRATAARGITELFLQGAATFGADHVDLFDGVLIDLVPHTELAARTDLTDVIARRGDRAASTAERVASFWQTRQPA
jgi:hypothetical protein